MMMLVPLQKPSRKRSQNPRRNRRANKFVSQTGQRETGNTSLRQPQENVFKLVNKVTYQKYSGCLRCVC